MRIFNSILLSIMFISNTSDIVAQQKQKAQLYMTNGTLLLGNIISTEKDMVTFKYFLESTRSQTRLIPFEQVQRLISSRGTLIIENSYLSFLYLESTALKSRANEEWLIVGSEGSLESGVIPIVVKNEFGFYARNPS